MIRHEWLSTYFRHLLGLTTRSNQAIGKALEPLCSAFSCPEDLKFFAQCLDPILKKYGIRDLLTANLDYDSGPHISLEVSGQHTCISFHIFASNLDFSYRHALHYRYCTIREDSLDGFLKKFHAVAQNFGIQRLIYVWTLSCHREFMGFRNHTENMIARLSWNEDPWSYPNPWITIRAIPNQSLIHSILLYPALQIDGKCYISYDLFMTDLHELFCRLNFIQDSNKK